MDPGGTTIERCNGFKLIISIQKIISIKTFIIYTGALRLATHEKETDIVANASRFGFKSAKLTSVRSLIITTSNGI